MNLMIVMKMMKILALNMTTTTTTTITNTRHLQHLLVKLHLAQQRHKSKASVFSLARAIACQPLATEPLIPAASPCCPAVRANET
jgi:hypothetical protein